MRIEPWWPPPSTPTPDAAPGIVTLGIRARGRLLPHLVQGLFEEEEEQSGISEEEELIWKTRKIAYGYIAPICIAVGIVGNLFTILVLKHARFKGMTYTFFRILAWSDMLSLVFCISFVIHLLQPLTPNYSTAYWYAHFEGFATNVPMSISVFTVVLITVERYFSVCRPTQFKQIHSAQCARYGFCATFVTAAVIWLPVCFMKEVREYTDCESYTFERHPENNETYYVACMEKNTLESAAYMFYSWTRQTVVAFIPIVLLIVLNVLIIKAFIGVAKRRQGLRQTRSADDEERNDKWSTKEDRNLIRMLCAVMISFSITMFPPGIANAVYTEFLSSKLEYEIFRAIANDLEILNHTMNFYLYMLLSKPVRAAVRGYFSGAADETDSGHSSENRNKTQRREAGEAIADAQVHNAKKLSDSQEKYNSDHRPVSQVSLVVGDCHVPANAPAAEECPHDGSSCSSHHTPPPQGQHTSDSPHTPPLLSQHTSDSPHTPPLLSQHTSDRPHTPPLLSQHTSDSPHTPPLLSQHTSDRPHTPPLLSQHTSDSPHTPPLLSQHTSGSPHTPPPQGQHTSDSQ